MVCICDCSATCNYISTLTICVSYFLLHSFLLHVQHVHPYGDDFLSSIGHIKTPNGHDSYAVAFASGGTTGNMKFVYRSDWEGK